MSENWYSHIALKSLANVSNVFLLATSDPVRIHQFLTTAKTRDIDKMLKTTFNEKIFFDFQRQKLFDLLAGTEVSTLSPFGGLGDILDSKLKSSSTLLIISYVFLQRHAEALQDLLASWSQSLQLYEKSSRVFVFCSDYSFFPPQLLKLVYAYDIPLPSEEERKTLLQSLTEDTKKKLPHLELNQQIINTTAGLTLHDIKTAFFESCIKARNIEVSVFTDYKIKILRDHGLFYIEPSRGFESVGGYDYLKNYIQQRIINVIKNPERASALGLRIPRGLLLYGPPGCGKTFFAKAFAKELNLPMITLSPADLLRGIVGETEARTRQLVALIESLAPIIVFIDEFDQLAIGRDRAFMGDSGVSRRMQNMLLEWLGDERRKAFIVGATNFVGSLDPAFIRPGRIDEIVLMSYPDAQARKQIISVQMNVLRKMPVKDINLEDISSRTFLFSGAELEKLVLEAASRAFIKNRDYVTQEDFDEAIQIFKINVDERLKRIQQMISEIQTLESVNQAFLQESLKSIARLETDTRLKSVLEKL